MYKKLTITEYKVNWPKHVPTFALFDSFIERFEKHPEWQEKTTFLTVNEESLKHGTFLMNYCNHIVNFNSLETAPHANLEKLLNNVDFSEDKTLWAIELQHASVVEKVVKLQNLEKTPDDFSTCILLDYKQKQDIMELLMEKFAKPPQGFYYDSLKESDIPQLAATLYSHPSWFFENVIKYNLTMGLYTNDGKIVACIAMREGGEPGMLHVDANYRRNKVALGVAAKFFAKLIEMGKPLFGYVAVNNEAAMRFFNVLGPTKIIGSCNRMTLRKS